MKPPKILVIDDDPTTCQLLVTVLQMEGYQTASHTRIPQGNIITLLDSEKPDLLLLDFHLEAEETLKYIVSIRANDGWKQLQIVIASAINRRQLCLNTGANGFILKPFNWQELIKELKQRLD